MVKVCIQTAQELYKPHVKIKLLLRKYCIKNTSISLSKTLIFSKTDFFSGYN